MPTRRGFLSESVAIFLTCISACTAKEKDQPKMLSKDDPVRPHCIGRSIFNLPSSFSASTVTLGDSSHREVARRMLRSMSLCAQLD